MDLLIVADPEDAVAAELADYVGEHARLAKVMDAFDAARLFTIEVRGGASIVAPDLPLFLRLPPPPAQRVSFDAEFQYGECIAQLYAAAALMRAPVINRPSGRTSPSAALTGEMVRETGGGVEIFSSQYPVPGAPQGEQFWVEDLATLRAAPWRASQAGLSDGLSQGDSAGPYRARWSDVSPAFETVIVLCRRAWRCSAADLEHLGLETRSMAVARALNLSLAAITWRVTASAREAVLVRVNPFPALEQLRSVWLGLGPQLLEVFFS